MDASAFETPSRWSFELPAVASHFDSHVREQLPFYELATCAVADLVRFFLQPGGVLVDIGAATGNVSLACKGVLEERSATAVSIEPSHEMVSKFRGCGSVVESRVEDADIPQCDVAVSFLTLAFVPPRARREIIGKVMERLSPGGAFILLERMECPANATASRLLISAAKLRSGAAADSVVKKEVSIAGVLRPLRFSTLADFNPWTFFAYGDFYGFVLEKPE